MESYLWCLVTCVPMSSEWGVMALSADFSSSSKGHDFPRALEVL